MQCFMTTYSLLMYSSDNMLQTLHSRNYPYITTINNRISVRMEMTLVATRPIMNSYHRRDYARDN